MTWSYSGDPATSARDLVRYLVADTLEDEPLVQDAEIDYQLSVYSDPRLAAAATAESLSRLFARQANTRTPELSVDFAERAKQYKTLAYQLRQDSAELGAVPYAGGISVADKCAQEAVTDRVAPAFVTALHDLTREDVLP
jgi:hypothetical protein